MQILSTEIPILLEPRSSWGNFFAGSMFMVSFIVLAIANLLRPGFYYVTTQFIIKGDGIVAFTKEFLPVNKRTSTLLYANFILSTLAINSLVVNSSLVNMDIGKWGGVAFILFNVYHVVSLSVAAGISGNWKVFEDSFYLKLTGVQWLGVAYFVIGVIWFFTSGLDIAIFKVIICLTLIEFLLRISKSFFASMRSGAPWYYIILYLCTLEILPITVVTLLISGI